MGFPKLGSLKKKSISEAFDQPGLIGLGFVCVDPDINTYYIKKKYIRSIVKLYCYYVLYRSR